MLGWLFSQICWVTAVHGSVRFVACPRITGDFCVCGLPAWPFMNSRSVLEERAGAVGQCAGSAREADSCGRGGALGDSGARWPPAPERGEANPGPLLPDRPASLRRSREWGPSLGQSLCPGPARAPVGTSLNQPTTAVASRSRAGTGGTTGGPCDMPPELPSGAGRVAVASAGRSL